MGFLDSHSHICDEAFKEDFDEVMNRIVESGMKHLMVICMNEQELARGLEIKQQYPFVDLALGIHPEDEKSYREKFPLERLEYCLKTYPEIAAVGEIGLDYYWVKDNKEGQKELFIAQIELARKYHKPILVHSRDAIGDTFDIMKAHRIDGLLHCFSGSLEMAREFVKLGYYISFAGPLTFKNAKEAKVVAKELPLDRILVETDCPYMAPVPMRGKRNEPSFVNHTGRFLSELREMDADELAKQIDLNYETLLGR